VIYGSVFLGRQVIIGVQLGGEGCDDVGGCEGEVRAEEDAVLWTTPE
jgi:hypothetical protein